MVAALSGAALALLLFLPHPSFAQQSAWYSASGTQINTGNTVKASVFFTLTGGADNNLATASDNLLFADVANTSSPFSRNRSDLLNVLLFNLSSSITPSTPNGAGGVNSSLWTGSTVVNSGNSTVPSQLVNGSWVFGKQTDADVAYKYGVSSAGFSNTSSAPSATANGVPSYTFSGFTRGNGADDYSLIPGNATRSASGLYVNGGNIPVVRGRIRLKIEKLNVTDLSQLTGVAFGYQSGIGTNGYSILTGRKVVIPEPSSALLLLVALPLVRRRRR